MRFISSFVPGHNLCRVPPCMFPVPLDMLFL
jgi:hypothetical protein